MGLPRQKKQNSPDEFKTNSQLSPRGAEPARCSVAIRPGGMLQLIYWEEKGDETSHWSRLDISAKAAQFLFYPALIEGTVTLGDIFRILYRDPVLSVVFANDLPSESMSMAFSRDASVSGHPRGSKEIKYLELYQYWRFDSSRNCYEPMHLLSLRGIGFRFPEREHADGSQGLREGERTVWDVSAASPADLANFPLRLSTNVWIAESDARRESNANQFREVNYEGFTLAQILHSVLNAISVDATSISQCLLA